MTPVQSDEPIAGFYTTALVRGGVHVPIRIWFGEPVIDEEIQDRAPRWNVEVNGKTDRVEKDDTGYYCKVALDIWRYWPWCARNKITSAEYNYLLAKTAHAKQWLPDSPAANPQKAIDWNAITPL